LLPSRLEACENNLKEAKLIIEKWKEKSKSIQKAKEDMSKEFENFIDSIDV